MVILFWLLAIAGLFYLLVSSGKFSTIAKAYQKRKMIGDDHTKED